MTQKLLALSSCCCCGFAWSGVQFTNLERGKKSFFFRASLFFYFFCTTDYFLACRVSALIARRSFKNERKKEREKEKKEREREKKKEKKEKEREKISLVHKKFFVAASFSRSNRFSTMIHILLFRFAVVAVVVRDAEGKDEDWERTSGERKNERKKRK